MLELELNSKGQFCKKVVGAGRRWPIAEQDVIIEIIKEKKCSYQEAEEVLEEAKKVALQQQQEGSGESSSLEEEIKRIQPFKHLKIFDTPTKLVVVWEKDNNVEILGSLDGLDTKTLANILCKWERDVAEELQKLQACINPKTPFKVSFESIVDACYNVYNPKVSIQRIKTEDEDMHPAVVEGVDIPSLRKIPYKKLSVTLENLHKYLQDFLLRVENHKHLCAVLWGQFIGRKWPYICYLYGKQGREGKTSFINMLGALTRSFATLPDKDSRFTMFGLYGKSIIMVPENDRSRLVSNKIVKAITGGSLLSIEEKGRSVFSGAIRGTMIVDANVPLKIGGRAFETERLLYFNVGANTIPKDKRISPDEYVKQMGSTPNEFLNYCRQCYEELVTEGGMLKEPSNHREIMDSLSDYVEEYEYEQLLKKLGCEFDSKESIEKAKLISEAKEKSNKKDFYLTSFMHYLEKNGVKEEGKLLVGICKKSQKRIDKLDKELQDAMPK